MTHDVSDNGLSADGGDNVYDAAFHSTQDVVTVGEVAVPTGQVVACDPFFCDEAMPFVRRVRPGVYPVQLRIVHATTWGPRVAYARMLFAPGRRATRLEEAVMASFDGSDYGVESGRGGEREDWLLHRLAGSDLTVAMFASGLGDGSYDSVWGVSDADEPVWLVTDFDVVSRE